MERALDSENAHYEALGYNCSKQNRGPCVIWKAKNGAEIWLCSQYDIDSEFLLSFHPKGQVFTIKDYLVPSVIHACADAGWEPSSCPMVPGEARVAPVLPHPSPLSRPACAWAIGWS